MRAFLATTVAATAVATKDINSLIKSFKSTSAHNVKKADISLVQDHLNSLPNTE
jgi:monomeric isocitrate dehydrogenase